MHASLLLPPELELDIVLRTLQLESPIGDVSTICRAWQLIVSQNLGQILLHRFHGHILAALLHACRHGKLEVATWLVSRVASLTDSNVRALLAVADTGQTELARLLLTAPQNAAHADYHYGKVLAVAAKRGHSEVVRMLLDAPQHAPHADSTNPWNLGVAAMRGHCEVVRMLLDAPQHAAHADSRDSYALVVTARYGHSKIAVMGRHS
eukprot:gene17137-biopygen26047